MKRFSHFSKIEKTAAKKQKGNSKKRKFENQKTQKIMKHICMRHAKRYAQTMKTNKTKQINNSNKSI